LTNQRGPRIVVISEQLRRRLHETLVDHLGADMADALMEQLPPSGWADVARQSDLDHLGTTLRLEMQAMEARFEGRLASLEARLESGLSGLEARLVDKMNTQLRTIMLGMVAMVVAVIGSMTGAVVTLAH
jgi:hypothetical protein